MKSLKVTSMLAVLMFLFITGMQAQTVTPSKKYITKEWLLFLCMNTTGNKV